MATRQLRTRTVPVKDPTPRPKKGARKPKAGLPPIETSDTPLEVPNDHRVPAPGTVPAPRRTKRGKAPVPEPAIEQDRPDGISEALLEHVPRHGCGGEGQLEVPSVVPADNDHEHRASRPPSRDTQPLPHGISPDPHPASLRPKRSYPRARPRNRDDPRPTNDDAYFMRRPNLDVPNDRGPQDRLGDGVSPSHEEEDVSHAVSNCPSPRDNHPPLDNNPSPIITNSSPDVVNRRAWDALEEAARLGKGIVAAEATLQEILGGRYDYAEWREALQAADGYDPDDTIEDCVQQLLRLKESTLQRIGELPAPIPPPVSPVAASRASRQRKVPRCAQGVELKTRLPAASDDGDLEDDNQDDSSDLYVASEDRDAAVVRAGDDSDDEEMQRDLDANGNASDDDAKPSGKGASKRRRGLSAKARGKQPAAANPAGSIRRAATPLAGEHPVHPSDEHPARPSVENPAPFPGERPASPSGEQPAKRPHKSGAVGQSTIHDIRAISLEYFDKLNEYAAMHDLTESRVYQIAGATRPSLRRENFWNIYQSWFSVHGAKEGYPDVHKYDRDQLLEAATEAYHVRRDPLGDDPTLDDYQRAFPEVVEFIREQGLQKAQQVVTDPVRARQLMRKNCEDGIIWAMRVYSETGLEIFGFMVDDSGDVGHFGGSPSYEEMWQHPSFTLNLEQSQKDIAGMVNTLRMERRRRATVSASDDRVIAQPRPQVDQAWEANEIILQKKYNTGPRNPSESLRDYHRRIVFNSVAKDIARIMFIDYGLPPSAMWTWRTNAMTLFYKFGLELRGWFRGWDHDCPGHPDATRAALNPSVKEWERAANARVAYDKGDDGDEELLRHAVRVVRWDPHIRAKDFRDLADKGLAYDVDDRIILRVNASPLFIEDEEEHQHSKNFEYGSRQRPRDDPAYDSKHANTKKGKKPRKGKKKVPQVDIDLDYQEPHCEPIQSTAAFDELVAAQRHDVASIEKMLRELLRRHHFPLALLFLALFTLQGHHYLETAAHHLWSLAGRSYPPWITSLSTHRGCQWPYACGWVPCSPSSSSSYKHANPIPATRSLAPPPADPIAVTSSLSPPPPTNFIAATCFFSPSSHAGCSGATLISSWAPESANP
ncbi:hypothetical protein EV122DRAFT_285008 [Schizophyllum commune]